MDLREYLILNNLKDFTIDSLKGFKSLKELLEVQDAEIYNYYKRVKKIAFSISFIFGFLSSVLLLSYSGKEPVNISYFLFFAFLMPITLAMITIFSIFSKYYFAPFKLIKALIEFLKKEKISLRVDSQLEKFLSLRVSILMQIYFAIAFILGFFSVLLIKDVAFAWSSTIITLEEFKSLIDFIATPWKSLLPNFVPSKALIEHSWFFRNNSLSTLDAKELAAWWRFLLATAIFYMFLLRVFLYLIIDFLFKKALKEAIKNSINISLIKDILNSQNIEIKSNSKKNYNLNRDKKQNLKKDECAFENIIAWNYQKDEIKKFLNSKNIEAKSVILAGGLNSFSEDIEQIKDIKDKNITLLIKSWDVPTLDFIDFLEELSKIAKSVGVFFDKLNNSENYKIWIDKIEEFELKNLKVCL